MSVISVWVNGECWSRYSVDVYIPPATATTVTTFEFNIEGAGFDLQQKYTCGFQANLCQRCICHGWWGTSTHTAWCGIAFTISGLPWHGHHHNMPRLASITLAGTSGDRRVAVLRYIRCHSHICDALYLQVNTATALSHFGRSFELRKILDSRKNIEPRNLFLGPGAGPTSLAASGPQ